MGLLDLIFGKPKAPPAPAHTDNLYARKSLLTDTELRFYQQLVEALRGKPVVVMVMVRMEDVIRVGRSDSWKDRQAARSRLKSRHFDFVIAEWPDLKPSCVIELDDSSHTRKKAISSDAYKSTACANVGLPIHRFQPSRRYNFTQIFTHLNYA